MAQKKKRNDGAGTIYQRKNKSGEASGPWWVKIHIDRKPIYESTGTESYAEACKYRDRMLARKVRGEISGGTTDRITLGELLDDLLAATERDETRKIRAYVVEANLRPALGRLKARSLTTAKIEEYRTQRVRAGASQATANRELGIVRSALYLGRKQTPPKVAAVPYFPMREETTIRRGFLSDAQYASLRDALPSYLRPLFIVAYASGARLGELLDIRWEQVDFGAEEIILRRGETKNGDARVLPFLTEDMATSLREARAERDSLWPECPWVFSRSGAPIKDFRGAWESATRTAGVPELHFHDLRRTAVRNLRRAGVPQVVRMRISGHRTDSMERRYSIVDREDFEAAKASMRRPRGDGEV
jgi:integrase